jgi:phage baseplate assembly protein W
MNLDHPFAFDRRGRTAVTDNADHVRDLIEQVLFTIPGERVNRPDFGSGVMQLVFAPNSDELAAATQLLIQSALQQWLGDWIVVERVAVAHDNSILRIAVDYLNQRTDERSTAEFTWGAVP